MRITGIAALTFALAAVLQAQDHAPGRDSPVGYSDTPVLPGQQWKVHDIARPHPKVITPATCSTPDQPGRAPSDAIVLFDGKDLSHWEARGKGADRGKMVAPKWKVENGYMEVVGGTGSLVSKEKFGDMQLHVEWAAPAVVDGNSQWRGNSGIELMSRYEIQVLDSYRNVTYADGQAGAIYGQWPPLVNASLKPGEWQTYDIIFEAPKFSGDQLQTPGYVTVIHNGVVVQNHQKIGGTVGHRVLPVYKAHAPEESLSLQDHDTKVRYRNIWVRRLGPYDQPETK